MSKAKEFLSIVEDTKKDRMLNQIKKHGDNLNAIFKTNLDSDTLSRKLFRLENTLRQANLKALNEPDMGDEQEKVEKQVLDAVDKITGFRAKKIPVFNNDDARGYALKIDSDWLRKNNASLYTDMGGYGILAPDFKE